MFLHHVALRVDDFDASLRFYTKGLGLKVRMNWISAASGKRASMLQIGESGALEMYEGGDESLPEGYDLRRGCYFHMAIGVDDVAGAFEAALQAGGKAISAPEEAAIPADPKVPIHKAFLMGPSGEQIELFKEI